MTRFRYCISINDFWRAHNNYDYYVHMTAATSEFCKAIGITDTEWGAFNVGDGLTVNRAVDRKIALLKDLAGPTPHIHTLFKIIDAQENSND